MFASPPTSPWNGPMPASKAPSASCAPLEDDPRAGWPPASPPAIGNDGLSTAQADLRRKLHQTLGKVADDYGRRKQFNTAIAAVMELLNAYDKAALADAAGRAWPRNWKTSPSCSSPSSPHLPGPLRRAETGPGRRPQAFPKADPGALVQDEIELVVQVNGKLRGSIRVAAGADKAAIEAAALAAEGAVRFMEGKPAKKGGGGAGPPGQYRRLRAIRCAPARPRPRRPDRRLRLPAAGSAGSALPYKTFYIALPENSEVGIWLTRYIKSSASTTQVIGNAKGRRGDLPTIADNRSKTILSLNAQGAVREFRLEARLQPSASSTPRARELVGPNEINPDLRPHLRRFRGPAKDQKKPCCGVT